MQLPCHIFAPICASAERLWLANVLNQHRAQILPMLGGQAGGNARALLGNDAAMRTLAIYSYALLPDWCGSP